MDSSQGQRTAFTRLEDFDNRSGVFVRRIRTDTTVNLINTSTNISTGTVVLASTVVPAGWEVALYSFKLGFNAGILEASQIAIQIDGVTVFATHTEAFTPDYMGEPEVNPIVVAGPGSTIDVVALEKTVTGDRIIITAIGKGRPIPSRVESEQGSL